MLWSIVHAPDLQAAISHARSRGGTVVMDLDGTLGPTGLRLPDTIASSDTLTALFSSPSPKLVIVTNRRQPDEQSESYTVLARARKPFTSRHRLPLDVSCVIGDQLLTDGLLAARLGVPLIHVPSADTKRRPLAFWGDRWLRHLFREQRDGHGSRD